MYRIALLFILVILSQSSFALGRLGHQLVCQVTFDHLSSGKQQEIKTLLANIPKKHQRIINRYLYQDINAPITFAKSCVWPDAIKNDPQYVQYKTWHYLNVSRKLEHITNNVCKKNCVTQAIKYHYNALKSDKNQWVKTQDLMFLGHWLGDIHQPLHVSFASDLGGNKVAVNSPDGKCTSIHWLWDTCLITREHLTTAQWLDKLNAQWFKSPIKTWQNSPVWQWADESLQLSRENNVGYCHLVNGRCIANTAKQNAHLYSKEYQQHYGKVLENRMLQASARLEKLLNNAL